MQSCPHYFQAAQDTYTVSPAVPVQKRQKSTAGKRHSYLVLLQRGDVSIFAIVLILRLYYLHVKINRKESTSLVVNAPKVLVIDDSATSALLMTRTLRKAGYDVVTATDGAEGLAKAVRERPHCLVLDVVLPGVSGFGVCRQLRALDPERNLSIIMVSGKDTPMDQRWGLRQGADRYLTKPVSEETLIRAVHEVLLEHIR
jgi:CheY-like chemotaxis protein